MTDSEWQLSSLADLGTVERGRSRHRPRNDPDLFGGDTPFFQTGDVKASVLHMHDPSQRYSDFGVAQSRLWDPGVACITIAANIAETAVLGVAGCFPDSVLGFTPSHHNDDAYFVKYLLDCERQRLTSISRGTTQDNLSLEKLLSQHFLVPGRSTRSRIVGVLKSLDELIENNRRRVEVLEKMARAIYREWFVHFRFPGHEDATLVESELGPIPEGWNVGRLDEVAEINRTSRTPSDSELIRYVDISCLGDRQVQPPEQSPGSQAPGRARRVVQAGDIVWSMVRPNRRAHALLVDPGIDWIASTGMAVVSPVAVPPSYLFEALSAQGFSDYLVSRQGGSAYPAVKAKDFKGAPVVVPEPACIEQFSLVVQPMHDLLWSLDRQVSELAEIRDLLLPRLVTGQIDVSDLDLDALVEEASV